MSINNLPNIKLVAVPALSKPIGLARALTAYVSSRGEAANALDLQALKDCIHTFGIENTLKGIESARNIGGLFTASHVYDHLYQTEIRRIGRLETALQPVVVVYQDYIASPAWKRKADAAKRRAGDRCQLCNGSDRLEAHHRTYETLGNEPDNDITVLYHNCHAKFHGKESE